MNTMPCTTVQEKGQYTVSAQWLSERISLAIFQIRDRPTVPVFCHVLFNFLRYTHTRTHANTLTSNMRLFVQNLSTIRAAIRAIERNTASYLKCWYQDANTGLRGS